MLLRHTLLYLPAQIVGPLVQLIAMIVWTHVVDEHTLGIITLVTATHELLQIALLSWWSQFALRYFDRYHDGGNVSQFYCTENTILLLSAVLQSIVAVAILFFVIAPDAKVGLLTATVGYVITRTLNLYIGERARVRHQVWVYSIQQIVGPSAGFIVGLVLIKLIGQSAEWPLAGYAFAQLVAAVIVLPKIGHGRSLRPVDRKIVNQALHYGIPIVIGGSLGWVGLNASRFIVNDMLGVAAAGLFAVGYGLGQRAAAVAAMLVTAAAFPLAVKSMEQGGSKVAMRQLADNSALLIAILAPSITGIYMLRAEIVHLLIAGPFQSVTLAVLPLSVLAGSIRSLRAHFVDQTFLLQGRTRLIILVAALDAIVTIVSSFILIRYWGLVGAAGATVLAAVVAAILSFALAFSRFGLMLPLSHLVPITLATAAMTALLSNLPEARSLIILTGHIAAGATVYATVLVVLYAPSLLRMSRLRQPRSEP